MTIRNVTLVALITCLLAELACSSLENNSGYKRARQEHAALALYPGSNEVNYYGGSNGDVAYFGKYYKANFTYQQLKEFYTERLPALGWKFANEQNASTSWFKNDGGKKLIFRNDERAVEVEYGCGYYRNPIHAR